MLFHSLFRFCLRFQLAALPPRRIPRHPDGAVAAVAEVVGHGRVGGGADVRPDVRAGAAGVAAHVYGRVSGVGVSIDITGVRPISINLRIDLAQRSRYRCRHANSKCC